MHEDTGLGSAPHDRWCGWSSDHLHHSDDEPDSLFELVRAEK
jgi:hypothetical protein